MPPGDCLRRCNRRPGFLRRLGAGGFTYIEVLVAIFIIGLVTPIFIGGLVGSLTGARRSEERGVAVAWVQGEIDFLRGQCFARLSPSVRKVTLATLRPGEPPMPAGFAAAEVRLEPAGEANLRATVSLYRKDWTGAEPAEAPVVSTTTYVADLRVAGTCP